MSDPAEDAPEPIDASIEEIHELDQELLTAACFAELAEKGLLDTGSLEDLAPAYCRLK